MKTINFELSKRLNEKWLLDNIETEYIYADIWLKLEKNLNNELENTIKTLTFEEVIEFLIDKWFSIKFWKNYKFQSQGVRFEIYLKKIDKYSHWDTLIEAIEKILEYLLDNNLLNK